MRTLSEMNKFTIKGYKNRIEIIKHLLFKKIKEKMTKTKAKKYGGYLYIILAYKTH